MAEAQEAKNPLVVQCPNCGAQLRYDIVKEVFECPFCGTTKEPESQRVEFANWKQLQHTKVLQGTSLAKAFECPSCGARTMAVTEDADQKCPFCQSTVVSANFEGADLPEVILPFKISFEEAKNRLTQWINNNPKNSASQVIGNNMDKFTACYLPYHILRGDFSGSMGVKSASSEKSYQFKSYINSTAVNASNDLNNLLLDGMEPFDMESARVFDFNFLTDQKAKIQNVEPKEMEERLRQETQSEIYNSLSEEFNNKEIAIQLANDRHESVGALMPVYLVKCADGAMAAVNGQTGKVSVTLGKKENKTKNWWVLPTVATIAVAIGGGILGANSDEVSWFLGAFLFGLVFGIINFVIAFSRHHDVFEMKVYTSKDDSIERQPDAKTEFFEDFGNGNEHIKLKFMTPVRLAKIISGFFIFTFLPVFIAMFIRLFQPKGIFDINMAYGLLWFIVPVFFIIVALSGAAKSYIYMFPMYYEVKPDGKEVRRRKQSRIQDLKAASAYFFAHSGWKILAISTFLLICSVVAILYA